MGRPESKVPSFIKNRKNNAKILKKNCIFHSVISRHSRPNDLDIYRNTGRVFASMCGTMWRPNSKNIA